jgi:SAM-dependent methyltransferase
MDWGVGEYEVTAKELEPFAERVVAEAAVQPGERVLDLGCGTGNAAALAAATGAQVVGADPAGRLVEVARGRVPEAQFVVAGAEDLPFEDASFDCLISIFAVIFAPDAEASMAEIVRVLKPTGRALITSWVPTGPIDAGLGTFRRAVGELSPEPPGKRMAWGDPDAVRALVERHGGHADVRVVEHRFIIDSPEQWIESFVERHPLGIPMAAALDKAGRLDEVRATAVERLRQGSEPAEGGRALPTSALVTRITR